MTTVPHFKRTESHLTGCESIFFHVSTETPEQWCNGIFHNSPYGIFKLDTEGGKLKLELISKGLGAIKFRKATVKTEEHAINKVLEWMGKIGETSYFLA